jgi:hypothetical protein
MIVAGDTPPQRAMLASAAIDGAAGQDVMMNPTGQERASV